MTLLWQDPTYYSEKLIGSYDSESGSYKTDNSNFNYLNLLSGQPYPEDMDKPSIFFFCNAKRLQKFDCLWLLGGVPLVSTRLADFLHIHAVKDIELIKPKVLNVSGEEISDGFFVMNAVNNANSLDMEQSDAEFDDKGNVMFLNKIVFKKDSMVAHLAFRETQSLKLLIAETLAEKMIAARFKTDKGLGFYQNENGRFTPYKGQA